MISHFSRYHERFVSQRNASCVMLLMVLFELTAWILSVVAMADAIAAPDTAFDLDAISWDTSSCPLYQKRYLRKVHRMSGHLVPLSATLMCIGFFSCCYLCKPPKGLAVGAVLRYPFLITLLVYAYFTRDIYAYFLDRDTHGSCLLNDDDGALHARMLDIDAFLQRQSTYYTLVAALMTPSLLCAYSLLWCVCRACNVCRVHALRCCHSVCVQRRTRSLEVADNINKKQRIELVERTIDACPICLRGDMELVLTKGCRHGCCRQCLRAYLEADLKNVAAVCFLLS